MPTLLHQDGFKFFFYANEHDPQHIHVMKNDNYAKIELKELKVVQNYLKPKELSKALEIIALHQKDFQRSWDEWFN